MENKTENQIAELEKLAGQSERLKHFNPGPTTTRADGLYRKLSIRSARPYGQI